MLAKPLLDKNAIIAKASKILPKDLLSDFVDAIAELEDNECHRTATFPITQLHKLSGIKSYSVYRAYINKIRGWRLHLQYGDNNTLILCDILAKEEHDEGLEKVMSRKNKYKKKKK